MEVLAVCQGVPVYQEHVILCPIKFWPGCQDEIRFFDDAKEFLTFDKESMVGERIFGIHSISEAMSECLHRLDWGKQKIYKRRN